MFFKEPCDTFNPTEDARKLMAHVWTFQKKKRLLQIKFQYEEVFQICRNHRNN